MPAGLDFSSTGNVPGGVNYTSLAPELQQVFFIGDGLTSGGVSQTITVPAGATRLFLATMDGFGWYNNTGSFQVQVTLPTSTGVPIQAQATVPTSNGVSIDTSSFSIAPTTITPNGNNTETLEWDLNLPSGTSSQTITWQSAVSGLQPVQSLPVVQGAVVSFVSQATPGSLTLPEQFVTGEQIIGINPPTQTVQPGAPASYNVTLLNPTSNSVTYDISVQGVPPSWVDVEPSVTVGPSGSADVPLVLESDSFAALSDYGFTVTANGDDGAIASVVGDLVLQGQPVLPDPNSHGIVGALTPTQGTAGQGGSAEFVDQLTNTGSADDTFSLTAAGLPSGVTVSFDDSTIDIPPGATNFRDVPFMLSAAPGTKPGRYAFTVNAASTTDPSVTGTIDGTLIVTPGGVEVTLNPPSGAPGGSFEAKVTNTGTVADTFKLTLGGPAALVSSLGTGQVTLAPGASQMVPINTGDADFAVQGNLDLMAMATSASNPAIQGAASADVAIPATTGMTAEFDPSDAATARQAGSGHVAARGTKHRQYRGFLFGDDHRHDRAGQRHPDRVGWLAHRVYTHIYSARPFNGRDRTPGGHLGCRPGDHLGAGEVAHDRSDGNADRHSERNAGCRARDSETDPGSAGRSRPQGHRRAAFWLSHEADADRVDVR